MHFVKSKTGELKPTAFCRATDSLQNCIYEYVQEFQNMTSFFHDICAVEVESDEIRSIWGIGIFFPRNTGYDAVFDGLSESEIKISDGQNWTKKFSKFKITKNGKNRFSETIIVSVGQFFNSCRSLLHPNEKFLEIKMISERRSTNSVSLKPFGEGHCNRGRDPME